MCYKEEARKKLATCKMQLALLGRFFFLLKFLSHTPDVIMVIDFVPRSK